MISLIIIELNSSQPGVIGEQLCTGPIFGDRTHEVLDYCSKKEEGCSPLTIPKMRSKPKNASRFAKRIFRASPIYGLSLIHILPPVHGADRGHPGTSLCLDGVPVDVQHHLDAGILRQIPLDDGPACLLYTS